MPTQKSKKPDTDAGAPTTLERFQFILREDLGYREECLNPDARFEHDIGMDSIDIVDMVLEVEEEFGVTIEDVEMDGIKTVGSLVEWLDGHKDKDGA
jgi:acyl carrier protein